ncbi:LPXTG-motif cell wall-anchored protein [Gillisia hiemivivida]
MKFFKYFEYAYLFIAAFFLFEAFRIWNEERNRAYLFIFFVVIAIFMFFFKRRFRQKLENDKH